MDLYWKVFKSNYGFVYGYTQNTLGAPDLFERITRIINWEPMDLGESDCLIKTKQRERF